MRTWFEPFGSRASSRAERLQWTSPSIRFVFS